MPIEAIDENTIHEKNHDNKQTKAKKGLQIYSISFLIFINILLRYPFMPHEIGWDSYFIHSLAQSISDNGLALWIIHPFSYIGMYPNSYASGIPFLLSSISQIANINLETTILLFSMLLGIISALGMFMLAGLFRKNIGFQLLIALIYSTSGGLLLYSTWTASTRGAIIAFIPLLLYVYLRGMCSMDLRFQIITGFSLLIFATIHRMFILIIPFIIVFPVSVHILKSKFKTLSRVKFSQRNSLKYITFLGIFGIIGTFGILLLFGILDAFYHEIIPATIRGDVIGWIIRAGAFIGRNVGLVAILSVLGFVSILFRSGKNVFDIFIIIATITFIPILIVGQYVSLVAIPIFCILAGIFVHHIIKHYSEHKKTHLSKTVMACTISTIVLSILITGIYQSQALNIYSEGDQDDTRYLEIEGYDSAMWLNTYNEGGVISNTEASVIGRRVTGISDVAHFPGNSAERINNGYISEQYMFVVYRSPLDYRFYKYGFIEDVNQIDRGFQGLAKWVVRMPITDVQAYSILENHNVAYYIINNKADYDSNTRFTDSVIENRYCVFHNEKVVLYRL